QVRTAARLTVKVLRVVHGLHNLIGNSPVFEQRSGNAQVPVVLDRLVGEGIGKEGEVTASAGEDVQLADALQETREHRRVAVDAGQPTCDRVTQRRHLHAMAPQLAELLFQAAQGRSITQLLDSERDGCRADRVESNSGYGGAQVGDRSARRVQGCGVRHAHELRSQDGFAADDPYDARGVGGVIGKNTL